MKERKGNKRGLQRQEKRRKRIFEMIKKCKTNVKKRKKSSYALGLIEKDIYSKDYYFIFGQAIPREIAVLSIYRLQGKGNKYKTRIKKEITNEVGHLLSLSHCPNQNCVMTFSNSIEGVDQKEVALCQECKEKL